MDWTMYLRSRDKNYLVDWTMGFLSRDKVLLWTGPWVFFRETKFFCGLNHGSSFERKVLLWTGPLVFREIKILLCSEHIENQILRVSGAAECDGGGGEMPLSYFPFLSGFPASCKTRLSIYREFHVLLWTWNVNSVPRKLRTIRLLINRKLRCWFRISSHFCWWKQRNARWCAKRTLNT